MLLFCTLCTACGGRDGDGPSKLNDLRVLGLLTDTPEFELVSLFEMPDQTLAVSVIDFHPSDVSGEQVDRRYTWQLCFSLGALAKFDCLADDKVLEMTTDAPSMGLTLDTATLLGLIPDEFLTAEQSPFSTMMDAGQTSDAVCPDGLGETCSVDDDCQLGLSCSSGVCEPIPATSPVPLIVRVTVESSDEQVVTAARTIGLRFTGELNRNPKFAAFEIGMGRLDATELMPADDGCLQLGPFDSTILRLPIKANFDDSSLQSYPYVDDGVCREGDEFESAFVSWYSTSGTFENQVVTTEYSDNELEFETPTAQTVRVYASLRDGRNGLAMTCFEFDRVETQQDAP